MGKKKKKGQSLAKAATELEETETDEKFSNQYRKRRISKAKKLDNRPCFRVWWNSSAASSTPNSKQVKTGEKEENFGACQIFVETIEQNGGRSG